MLVKKKYRAIIFETSEKEVVVEANTFEEAAEKLDNEDYEILDNKIDISIDGPYEEK